MRTINIKGKTVTIVECEKWNNFDYPVVWVKGLDDLIEISDIIYELKTGYFVLKDEVVYFHRT